MKLIKFVIICVIITVTQSFCMEKDAHLDQEQLIMQHLQEMQTEEGLWHGLGREQLKLIQQTLEDHDRQLSSFKENLEEYNESLEGFNIRLEELEAEITEISRPSAATQS